MIEGLKIDMTTEELAEHLALREKYHLDKAQWSADRATDLKAGGGEFQPGYSGNPLDGLEAKRREHVKQAAYFRVVREHLVPNETYRLNESDLARIEIAARVAGNW